MPLVTHVALLRGINVGGKNIVPMKDLAAMFTAAGCRNVSTYIQSGNVIFQAEPELAAKIPSLVTVAPVVVRTLDQMRRVATANPYPAGSEELLSVMFLAAAPDPAALGKPDPNRSPGDTYIVVGDAIYNHTPNGMAKTKLTNAYFDSKLKTVGTSRNWRTVLKLIELMENATTAA